VNPRTQPLAAICAVAAALTTTPSLGWAQLRRPAELVLVDTGFTASDSAVVVRDLASGRERVAATLSHAPGWGAEGRVSPDGRYLAVAVLSQGNRPWQHAGVYVVDLGAANAAPRRVLDEAVFTAPAWLSNDTLAAVRAVGQHEPAPADSRAGRRVEFDFEVVAVALGNNTAPRSDVILRDRCDWLALVGADARGELVAARTAWLGVSLVAVRPGASASASTQRTVAALGGALLERAQLARDARSIVFAQVAAPGSAQWLVRAVDLDGATRDWLREPNDHLTPVPLASGVAYGSADGHAVLLADGANSTPRVLARDAAAERLVVRLADADGGAFVYERLGPGGTRVYVADASGRAPVEVGDGQHWREAMGFRGWR
jgi:hypothetical protein